MFNMHIHFLGRDKSEPRFALGSWFIDWCVAECCIVFLMCNILMCARHTNVHTRACNSVYVLPYVSMHVYVYMHIHKYVYVYTHTCINTHIYICVYIYIHIYIHTYIYTCTNTYTYI